MDKIQVPAVNIGGKMYDCHKNATLCAEALVNKTSIGQNIEKNTVIIETNNKEKDALLKIKELIAGMGNSIELFDKNEQSVFDIKSAKCADYNCAEYIEVINSDGANIDKLDLRVYNVATADSIVLGEAYIFPNQGIGVVGASETFQSGTMQLRIKNDFKYTKQGFGSCNISVTTVDGAGNTFKAGTFYIGDAAITLVENDTLTDIATKINNEAGNYVIADAVKVPGFPTDKYVLTLASKKNGAQNYYKISDLDGILQFLQQENGNVFIKDINNVFKGVQYVEVTLEDGNDLNTIKEKFNNNKDDTLMELYIAQLDQGEYTIVINSMETGVGNAIDIYDPSCNFFNKFVQGVAPQDSLVKIARMNRNITKSSNDVKILGVDIRLLKETSNTLRISLVKEYNYIVSAIESFVQSFNAISDFISKSQARNSQCIVTKESIFNNNDTVNGIISTLNDLAIKLNSPDIGIHITNNKCNIPVLFLDKVDLDAALKKDFSQVKDLFKSYFSASQGDFAPVDVYKADESNISNIDIASVKLNIDTSKATTMHSISFPFDDDAISVVEASPSSKFSFKPGTFYINSAEISLEVGDTLIDIERKINKEQYDSGVAAQIEKANNKFFIKLTKSPEKQFSSSDFNYMQITDGNNILQNTFGGMRKAGDFADTHTVPQGVIKINNTDITVGAGGVSLSTFVDLVNAEMSTTNVSAVLEGTNPGYKQIIFKPQNLAVIDIQDDQNILDGKISVVSDSNPYVFYDLTKVASASVKTKYNKTYSKNFTFKLNNLKDLTKGGSITMSNCDSSELKVYDYSLRYTEWRNMVGVDIIWKNGLLSVIKDFIKSYADTSGVNIINNVIKYYETEISFTKEILESLNDKKDSLMKQKVKEMNDANIAHDRYANYNELYKDMMEIFNPDK